MNDFSFTSAQQHKALRWLVLFHIAVIASSNYLVQFPFTITLPNGFAVHSTWGALSFPFIFLATDLTVRIFGQRLARRIIFRVMFPALLLSYVISVLFHDGTWTGWGSLADFQPLVFRIALASFAAYAFGQVMDIFVFNRLRQMKAWWVAPTASTCPGYGAVLLDRVPRQLRPVHGRELAAHCAGGLSVQAGHLHADVRAGLWGAAERAHAAADGAAVRRAPAVND